MPDRNVRHPNVFLIVGGQTFLSVSNKVSGRRHLDTERLEINRRQLPHWRLRGATYLVTFRLSAGFLVEDEVLFVKQHIVSGHGRYYHLLAAQVMPDHVHLILRPSEDFPLSRIMKGIKGVTARRLNLVRGKKGSLWQDEYLDRILRNETELRQKLKYMLANPLKANLCKDPWTYPGWYLNEEES